MKKIFCVIGIGFLLMFGQSTFANELAQDYFDIATDYFNQGDYQNAVKYAKFVLELVPENPQALKFKQDLDAIAKSRQPLNASPEKDIKKEVKTISVSPVEVSVPKDKEVTSIEARKVVAPRVETPKTEVPQVVVAPRVETPKVEVPQVAVVPKSEAPASTATDIVDDSPKHFSAEFFNSTLNQVQSEPQKVAEPKDTSIITLSSDAVAPMSIFAKNPNQQPAAYETVEILNSQVEPDKNIEEFSILEVPQVNVIQAKVQPTNVPQVNVPQVNLPPDNVQQAQSPMYSKLEQKMLNFYTDMCIDYPDVKFWYYAKLNLYERKRDFVKYNELSVIIMKKFKKAR